MDEMGPEELKSRKSGIWAKTTSFWSVEKEKIYIVLVSVIEKSPRASLSSPTTVKMEKKKKKEKEKKKKKKEKKLENARGEALPSGVVMPGL